MRGTERVRLSAPPRGTCRLDEHLRVGVEPWLDITRRHHRHALGLLGFRACEVLDAIQPEERGHLRMGPPGQERKPPAAQRRREPQGRDGVTGVVLAVAERPLAIFPRFAPVDRRQAHQKAVSITPIGRPGVRIQRAPLLQPMLARCVMSHMAVANEVRLRWMEIAARGIDAQRPSSPSRLLPCRQPHGAAKQFGDGGIRHHLSRCAAIEERVVRNVAGDGLARERDEIRAVKAAEGVGLRRPVEPAGRPGESVEVVLGGLVVREGRYLDSSLIRRSSSAIA